MKSKKSGIVIIDDDVEVRSFLKEVFENDNYHVELCSGATEALTLLKKSVESDADYERILIICDLKLPDIDGIELMGKIRNEKIDYPLIMITAHQGLDTAIEALRNGAYDYISKPINETEISVIVSRAIKQYRLEKEYQHLKKQVRGRPGPLIGKSAKMHSILNMIERVSASSANVLINGESGTGKEIVAQAIHQASPRSKAQFIAVNCSAIPDQLLESELFGHKKGSFTGAQENRRGLFEEAEGGTIFLDEIGDMPMQLQSKLLRVIQERKIKPVGSNKEINIDVRIIAATHRDLKESIASNTFREDLYFRLCVVPISIPPLRERTEDIVVLAEFFLKKYCDMNGQPLKYFTKAAVEKMLRLPWRGNVRELENAIERAVVLSNRNMIDDTEIRAESEKTHVPAMKNLFVKLPTISQLEREYINYVLNETSNRKEKAAEILGINRKTLYRKERELGLERNPRSKDV